MNEDVDLEPDAGEILQEEEPERGPAVSVTVEGPVRVQPLPSDGNGMRGWVVTDSEPVQVLRADPHRSRAVVHVVDVEILMGGTQAEVLVGNPAHVAAGAVLVLKGRDDLWVMSAVGNEDARVTVIQERWA